MTNEDAVSRLSSMWELSESNHDMAALEMGRAALLALDETWVERGRTDAAMDVMENVPFASISAPGIKAPATEPVTPVQVPEYVPWQHAASYMHGYLAAIQA